MSDTSIKVLLVEDDEEDYMIARDLLAEAENQHFDIQWADTLAAAYEALSRQTPDVVLLDLSLPDSHGWETFVQMHAQASHVSLILLTGLADEAMGVRAVQNGAQDYLVKGHIESHMLVRSIRYSIERKRTEQKLAQVAAALHSRNLELADDLNMAREVQLAMLPTRYPSFPAGIPTQRSALQFAHVYRPSETIGGDFFSVFPVSATAAGILVCDVMGHGMRAALITAIVRGLLEELKPVSQDVSQFMSHMNEGLMAVLRRPDQVIFVSSLYMVLSIEDGSLTYVNAGHPVPIHIRRGDGRAGRLGNGQADAEPALGIIEGYEYTTRRATLEAADRLLLFTDGIFEAENAEGSSFDEEGLVQAAQRSVAMDMRPMLEQVLSEVERFVGHRGFADDVCLVGIELDRLAPDGADGGTVKSCMKTDESGEDRSTTTATTTDSRGAIL